jgi:GMP synthase-like glutamine amidotransferase
MILIVDMTENDLSRSEFVGPIQNIVKLVKHDSIVRHHTDINESDLESASHIILSGTPVLDDGFQAEKFSWLLKIHKPVLGICAGMQAICTAFGGRIIRGSQIGMMQIETIRPNPLFSREFKAYALHRNKIKPGSIKEFDVLAVSGKCIEGVKHKERNIFGVLFHPEVRNPDIIERFLKIR